MTRSTITSAVTMGLRRCQGKSIADQVDSVMLAIDLALDIESNGSPIGRDPEPEVEQEIPDPVMARHVSPVDAGDDEEFDPAPQEFQIPKEPPPPPQAPHPPSRLVIASNVSDIDREAAMRKPRVRSVFLGGSGKTKTRMVDIAEWISRSFPSSIRIRPTGVDHDVELQRNIHNIPMVGEGRKAEIEAVVKVTYKHAKMDSQMEVGYGIRVGDVDENGYPDVQGILDRIERDAREMYRLRPKFIDGVAPTGPSLDTGFRNVVSNLRDPAKAKTQGNTDITFGDADEAIGALK